MFGTCDGKIKKRYQPIDAIIREKDPQNKQNRTDEQWIVSEQEQEEVLTPTTFSQCIINNQIQSNS